MICDTIDSIAYGHGIGNARRLYRYYPYPGCGFTLKRKQNLIAFPCTTTHNKLSTKVS